MDCVVPHLVLLSSLVKPPMQCKPHDSLVEYWSSCLTCNCTKSVERSFFWATGKYHTLFQSHMWIPHPPSTLGPKSLLQHSFTFSCGPVDTAKYRFVVQWIENLKPIKMCMSELTLRLLNKERCRLWKQSVLRASKKKLNKRNVDFPLNFLLIDINWIQRWLKMCNVYGDRVSCCSTTFWKLLLNDWNFTPHMARPRQSVELGGVSPFLNDHPSHLKFWMMINRTWSGNKRLLQWTNILAITQLSSLILQMMMIDVICNIDLSTYSKSILESYQMAVLFVRWKWSKVDKRSNEILRHPFDTDTKQGEPFARSNQTTQSKWNAVATQMFIWDLGSWIWLLGVKTPSQMDVAPWLDWMGWITELAF